MNTPQFNIPKFMRGSIYASVEQALFDILQGQENKPDKRLYSEKPLTPKQLENFNRMNFPGIGF